MAVEKTMEKIVALCKNRGFVFPGSEIYGGLANSWDYGPLGVEFKNNVKKAWWKKFVQESPYNVGVDCAILMNPEVWVASGHVGGFSDPLMDCKQCKTRHRADKLIEDATNGEVVFMVAANSGDAREAAVTLTYGMLEQKVTIQQSEWVELAPEIDVVSELTVAFEGGAQSIEYSIENPKEGVELTAACDAEWISNIAVAADAITFDVAANETEEVRNADINLAYGDITAKVSVFQLSENADAGMNYLVYNIVSFEAENQTTTVWDIVMSEKDDVLGTMNTRISFKLNSENVMYINDGTYTVADGGILVNTFTNNDYSTYRYNNSGNSADITDANIEVKNDLEAQTTVIKGTFTAGNNVVSFEYNGKVKGFIYNDISEEGITEWTTFATKYSFGDFIL